MLDALAAIKYNKLGVFPRGYLQQIIERKDEAIPHLLQIVEEARNNPKIGIDEPDRIDFIFAGFLLSQFRETAFLPILIDILTLPDGRCYQIFGDDTITESVGRWLASVYGQDMDPIKQLIETPEVDEFVREQGMIALVILALHERVERLEILHYFRHLLMDRDDIFDMSAAAMIVSSCNVLYPIEIAEDIRQAFHADLIDEGYIRPESIERTFMKPREEVLKSNKSRHHYQLIDNTIDEMQNWACFHRRSTVGRSPVRTAKIGRNEKCPCGSNKKYKKCCGLGVV